MTNPKTLQQKTPNYEQDSFSSWLEKTKIVAQEEGDLNNLNANIQLSDTPNLVDAINHVDNETKKMLIKAIAMS
jgi:hypothetical protein